VKYTLDKKPSIFIKTNPSSSQGGCYIRTIPPSVQFEKKTLVIGLKGPGAKTK
jgi:hypothetical protein